MQQSAGGGGDSFIVAKRNLTGNMLINFKCKIKQFYALERFDELAASNTKPYLQSK